MDPCALLAALTWSTWQDESPGARPWAWSTSTQQEFEFRSQGAKEDGGRVELARWCASRGIFEQQLKLLRDLVAKDPDHAGARALLGHESAGESWVLEETTRFRREAPEPLRPGPIGAAEKRKVLASRDVEIQSSGRSSYFDLRTDLDASGAVYYSKVLDEHFRRFKTRFKAHTGDPIDVLLFSSRSDYFRFYSRHLGEGGENVHGFYYADQLVFYDDAGSRGEVVNTARHECTHLLVDRYFGRARIPIWLSEGMACYFAAGCELAEGQYTASLLLSVLDRVYAGKDPLLGELLGKSREEFTFEDYAHAWSWVHFLNLGRREKEFQEFLETLVEPLAQTENEVESRLATRRAFEEAFGPDLAGLESEWRKYYTAEYALSSDRQRVDFARHCLFERLHAQKEQEERERAVDMALWALEGVGDKAEEDVLREAAFARVFCQIRRIRFSGDVNAWRLGLRSILDELKGLPPSFEASPRGRLAFWAAEALVEHSPGGPDQYPRRGRDVLLGFAGETDESMRPAVESLVVLYDDLLRLALESLSAAMQADPLDRQAVHDGVCLATSLWPECLEPIFPRMQLLVEVDPDDENLAAFAVVYQGLGNQRWADRLWSEAERRNVFPFLLSDYRDYLADR